MKMTIIEVMSNTIKTWDLNRMHFSSPAGFRLFCSRNFSICESLRLLLDPSDPAKDQLYCDFLESFIGPETVTTSDKVYYAQILIFRNKIEQAICILNDVIEEEGDYSLSVVIWSKPIWESNFLDAGLSKELRKSSANYVVFPSNLHARYLLVGAYNLLGQTDRCERNIKEFIKLLGWYKSFTIKEFIKLLGWYKSFTAFAPMPKM